MTAKKADSDKDGEKEGEIDAKVAQGVKEEIDTSDKEMKQNEVEEKAVCSINVTYPHHLSPTFTLIISARLLKRKQEALVLLAS